MQAIILAAGMGRRLGRHTKDNTKCMVEVNGRRLIDRMLTQLSGLGLRRVVIVVGYKGDNLKRHIGSRYEGRLNIEYVENPVYDRTNNIYSLFLAKDKLKEDDTLLLESDLIFSDRMLPMIAGDPRPNIALVSKYETWMDGTMVKIDNDCNIVNFVPKKAFCFDDADEYYKTVNIYKFSREFATDKYVPFLEAYCHALGNNEYYEQVLRVITLLNTSDLKALPVEGEKWYEIDDAQDLDIAEALFAEGERLWRDYSRRFGGFWRFPQMLDFNYLVNPYFPTPSMKAEMSYNFDTLLTEYPSGMSVNSLLASKNFGVRQDMIVPGNGAAELIKVIMQMYGGKLGVALPTFEEYPNRKRKDDVVAFTSGKDGFAYTADDLMEYFGLHPVDMLLLINPDNPSGNMIPRQDVMRLIDWCGQRKMRIVIDESFVDFSTDGEAATLLDDDILERNTHLFVMKSISKSYGVPGLRLGVLASGDVSAIAAVKREVSIWNINSFAEFFMQILGKYQADYRQACATFRQEREKFKKELEQIPFLRVMPSEANYFLCEVLPPYTATELSVTLIKNDNILIKDCSYKKAFGGKQYVRIAIRDRKDDSRLICALKKLTERQTI